MGELERIQDRYRERDANPGLTGFWTLRNPVVLHLAQERERVVLRALTNANIDLGQARVLDVGCGLGTEFANFLRWGARLDRLAGVDLMMARLTAARAQTGVAVAQASATQLPFADGSFDLVSQNVVFSSIVDGATRVRAAAEMQRVLRPGGHVLWYDAARTRGNDPHFRPVPRAELLALFPGVDWQLHRLTTDLGLIRRVHTAFGVAGMRLFDLTGGFRTHLLGVGRRRAHAG